MRGIPVVHVRGEVVPEDQRYLTVIAHPSVGKVDTTCPAHDIDRCLGVRLHCRSVHVRRSFPRLSPANPMPGGNVSECQRSTPGAQSPKFVTRLRCASDIGSD